MKMTKEDRDEWVAALRSGKFPQIKGALRRNYGYCCLGVLSELQAKKGIIEARPPDERWNTSSFDFYRFGGEIRSLPPALVGRFQCAPDGAGIRWDELPENIRTRLNMKSIYFLAGLNDYGISFAEIADLIEAKVEIIDNY